MSQTTRSHVTVTETELSRNCDGRLTFEGFPTEKELAKKQTAEQKIANK